MFKSFKKSMLAKLLLAVATINQFFAVAVAVATHVGFGWWPSYSFFQYQATTYFPMTAEESHRCHGYAGLIVVTKLPEQFVHRDWPP